MNVELKEICERLIEAAKLCEKTNYNQFPLNYLNEITKEVNELVDPSEEVLINRLNK